jgi:hypothetical protein
MHMAKNAAPTDRQKRLADALKRNIGRRKAAKGAAKAPKAEK